MKTLRPVTKAVFTTLHFLCNLMDPISHSALAWKGLLGTSSPNTVTQLGYICKF
jgi:hypothetical protein